MEITVYPRSFGIQAGKTQTPQGEVDVVKVNVQDASTVVMTPAGPIQLPGPVVQIVFAAQDWDLFREAVADPEGAQARQEARSKIAIALPTGLGAKLKQDPTRP